MTPMIRLGWSPPWDRNAELNHVKGVSALSGTLRRYEKPGSHWLVAP
jgi:hypothetical protein